MRPDSSDPVVILAAARTPMGAFQGDFASLPAATLGATALAACLARSGVTASQIDEVLMGCVLPAGQGQAPARQAALGAGLPDSVPATTVNKMCGSGMKAVMLADAMLSAGQADFMLAGGMESMSNAPYLLPKARSGYRMGHQVAQDHMFLDGLEDAYQTGTLMGVFAEATAQKYGFSRAEQDEFALRSLARAQQAIQNGWFADEIVPVTVSTRNDSRQIDTDEQPGRADATKIPLLKPAFAKDGSVTAANSSSISDGAAALLLTRQSLATHYGLKPLAKIVASCQYAHAPAWFSTAPVGAIQKLFAQTGWGVNDVDLFEINEAFAVVTMAAMQDLALSPDSVNIHGGACALGHPIGASGARILVSLIAALRRIGGRRGVASLCIGGGEATALALEILP